LLFLGVLAAYVVRSPELWQYAKQRRSILKLICATGTWVIASDFYLGDSANGAVVHSMIGLCVASYILLIRMGGTEGRILLTPWLRHAGTISYGLYLIHQPISGLMHGLLLDGRPDIGSPLSLLVTILAMLVSFGIAWLSWFWLESPLIRFGHKWRYFSPPTILSSSQRGVEVSVFK
jgi:peptidoglycan/LPS O-acetylase OafA/YrhL